MNKKKLIFISLLVIVITVFIINKLLFSNNASSKLSDKNAHIIESYELMSHNIKKHKSYEEKKNELLDRINKLSVIMEISQEEIITILNDAFNSCNITPSKIEFSEVQIKETEKESLDEINVQTMNVNISFTSELDKIFLFLEKIQNNDIDIVVKDIRMINNDGGEKIYCTINLSFYGFPLEV